MRGRSPRYDLPVRRGSVQVRRQPIRRSPPRFLPIQMYALVAMLLCAFMTVALASSPVLAGRRLEVQGARFTGEAIVSQLAGMNARPNLFGLQTDRIAARLVSLPAVLSARVEIRLPDTVAVTLREREPRIVWVVGDVRYVADEKGLLFGMVDAAGNPVPPAGLDLLPAAAATRSPSPSPSAVPPRTSPSPSATTRARAAATRTPASTSSPGRTATPRPSPKSGESPLPDEEPSPGGSPQPRPSLLPLPTPDPAASAAPGAVSLPVVYDRRAADASLRLGDYVDPIALDAGFRLASLEPAEVGSTARAIDVVVDDVHGFTLAAPARGWVAEFGFYTQTLRKVTAIPGQVRALRSVLLWAGEDKVAWVWLMADISDSRLIDYLPK